MASCIYQIISNLLMLILLLFSCSGRSQDDTSDCIPSIRVPRNTVWKSPEKETLMINCTGTGSHCWKNLLVSWCKIEDDDHCRALNHSTRTAAGWRDITEDKRMFFLVFWSLSMQDAGLYRCRSYEPVDITSHSINIIVTDTRDTEQSAVQQVYVVYSIGIVVTLLLTIIVLLKTTNNKDSDQPLEDEDLLTTVSYEVAEDSSHQE